MASPLTQGQIRAAGGIGSYDFALTNLYNQDYPDYGYPEAMLTGRAPTPAQTAASDALIHILAGRQAQAGVVPGDRIVARITGNSGPEPQPGSAKRALAGLLVLAVVADCTAWNMIDRHRPFAGKGRRRR